MDFFIVMAEKECMPFVFIVYDEFLGWTSTIGANKEPTPQFHYLSF